MNDHLDHLKFRIDQLSFQWFHFKFTSKCFFLLMITTNLNNLGRYLQFQRKRFRFCLENWNFFEPFDILKRNSAKWFKSREIIQNESEISAMRWKNRMQSSLKHDSIFLNRVQLSLFLELNSILMDVGFEFWKWEMFIMGLNWLNLISTNLTNWRHSIIYLSFI